MMDTFRPAYRLLDFFFSSSSLTKQKVNKKKCTAQVLFFVKIVKLNFSLCVSELN